MSADTHGTDLPSGWVVKAAQASAIRARYVLISLLVLMLVSGLIEPAETTAAMSPLWWMLLSGFLSSFLPFYWYRLDSVSRHFLPSRWMSTGVVTMTPIVLPVYLLRSRPRGQRGRALLRCFGFFLLMLVATGLGALLRGVMPGA